MPFKRNFPFIPQANGLYIIRGPRQIGKTSWLKTILAKQCKKRSCYYQSCERISDYKELGVLLDSLANREIILLDEISFVDQWERAIKYFIDSGKSKIIILTGSHAFDLKRGSDRMPGRFAAGGEFELLPMDFPEFEKVRKQAKWHTGNELSELEAFFRVGGFPLSVAKGGRKAVTSLSVIETYWKWLAGDIVTLGKREEYLKEILVEIARVITTPVSLNNFSNNTSFGSHNTVSEYLEVLEACYAVRTLFAIDIDTGIIKRKKNRKIYFTDPIIYWLALQKSEIDFTTVDYSRVAEMVAHEFLTRRHHNLGYFSNKNGEVDFVKPKSWAIEVKWSPVATNISKTYHNLKIPFKQVWTQNNFLNETNYT
ncbi:MAG: ATP-binding protein [Bdellovibrionota bacterium]